MASESDPRSNDLDWQAFLYASNELSADERAAFESRLANDQAAQEALASMVSLAEAVCAAESDAEISSNTVVASSTQVAEGPSRRHQAALWMALGAACLAMIFGLRQVMQTGNNRQPIAMQQDAQSDGKLVDLAQHWAQNLDEHSVMEDVATGVVADPAVESTYEEPLPAEETESLEFSIAIDNSDDADEEETGIFVPSWMLAAVAQPVSSMDDTGMSRPSSSENTP